MLILKLLSVSYKGSFTDSQFFLFGTLYLICVLPDAVTIISLKMTSLMLDIHIMDG